jgi:nitrogen fixation-related uncharacterized protein
MSQNEYLLIVWVTITVLAVSGMVAALIWAIRSHQFQQQDHARHLALESGIPSEPRTEVSGLSNVAPPSPLGGGSPASQDTPKQTWGCHRNGATGNGAAPE